jgi:hypothetical protein
VRARLAKKKGEEYHGIHADYRCREFSGLKVAAELRGGRCPAELGSQSSPSILQHNSVQEMKANEPA